MTKITQKNSIENKEALNLEVEITYNKHLAEWLGDFMNERETIKVTNTGHHHPEVEDKLIEVCKYVLEKTEQNNKELIEKHGRFPFTYPSLKVNKNDSM